MMTPRLSQNQKLMLCLAFSNKGQLTNHQAIRTIYGLPATPDGRRIDRSKISYNRVNAAAVGVTRSFNRLANRGLADRVYNYGIYLTKSGIRAAKEIGKGI